MAFSHARRAGQQHVAPLSDEAARRQVEERLFLDRAVEVPVNILQGFRLTETGRLQTAGK
jgi:hypothetical protein